VSRGLGVRPADPDLPGPGHAQRSHLARGGALPPVQLRLPPVEGEVHAGRCRPRCLALGYSAVWPRLGQEAPVDFGRGEPGGHRHHLSPRPSLEPLLSGSSPTSPPLPVAREAQGAHLGSPPRPHRPDARGPRLRTHGAPTDLALLPRPARHRATAAGAGPTGADAGGGHVFFCVLCFLEHLCCVFLCLKEG
ncbi:unnamed protein product, partial [Effrenium voratum]